MKIQDIKNKLNQGFKIVVCLQPTKKHDKITLKTYLIKEGVSVVHPVYYNHCKGLLNGSQLRLIKLYNEIKNWGFREKVDFNIAFKKDPENKELIGKSIVLKAISKIEYLEQN